MLPGYNYREDQIERICAMILWTKLPPRPADLLEEIICDSDLDYLGRTILYPCQIHCLKKEEAQNKMKELNDWNKMQVKLISGHQYLPELRELPGGE